MGPMSQTNAAKVLELHNNKDGVPGMIGHLGCMHEPWKNCPNSLCDKHVGKEGVSMLVLKPNCGYYLYFWHHDFEHAGALNNLNIWEWSNFHKSFIDGSMGDLDFKFKINSEKFKMF